MRVKSAIIPHAPYWKSNPPQQSAAGCYFLPCFISLFCVRISVAPQQPASCTESFVSESSESTQSLQPEQLVPSRLFLHPSDICTLVQLNWECTYMMHLEIFKSSDGLLFQLQVSICCVVCCLLFFLILCHINIPSCGSAAEGLSCHVSVTCASAVCFVLVGQQVIAVWEDWQTAH